MTLSPCRYLYSHHLFFFPNFLLQICAMDDFWVTAQHRDCGTAQNAVASSGPTNVYT